MLNNNCKTNKESLTVTIAVLLGIAGIYIGLVNMYVWLVLLFVYLFKLNRIEFGLVALFIGSSIWGRIFESNALHLSVTIVFLVLGICFLWKEIQKIIIINDHSYCFCSVLIGYFLVMYLLGPQNEYADDKILKLVVRGYIWLTAFLIFVQERRISNLRLAIPFLILAMFYLSQAYQLYQVIPHYLFDVSFFREGSERLRSLVDGRTVIYTHGLGYLGLGSLTFFISGKNIFQKNNRTLLILFGVASFLFILISGARQVLVASIFIIPLGLLVRKKDFFSIKKGIVFTVMLLTLLFAASLFNSKYISSSLSSDISAMERLNRDYLTPVRVFRIDPVFGVGFGGYPEHANKNYPHNIFMEILCELGIVGFFCILTIVFVFFKNRKKVHLIHYKTLNGTFMFPIFVVVFFHSMISYDLSGGMLFFVLLFTNVIPRDLSTCIYKDGVVFSKKNI